MTTREVVRAVLEHQQRTGDPMTSADLADVLGVDQQHAAAGLAIGARTGKLSRVECQGRTGRSVLGHFVSPSGLRWLDFVEARDGLGG